MKISVITLGCRVNQCESNLIESNLIENGFTVSDLSEQPDYCVINTCSVTAKSDYQSRQMIRRALRTGAKVIVTGCYAQMNSADILKINPAISIINNPDKLNIIKKITNNDKIKTLSYSSNTRPYIKIQDGCNNVCSYCIVRIARGPSRSINQEEIIKQILKYASEGYREVVLTGIHLGSYGHDLIPKVSLSILIKTILIKTNIHRIRLSSLEISEVDDEIMELIGDSRLCRHLHLPMQSGDNRILKLMNRPYKAQDFRSVINRIIKKTPDINLGTDIIAGFPGENSGEFLNTKKLLEEIPVRYMHIFPFSARRGTDAFLLKEQVSEKEKKMRCKELQYLNRQKKTEYMHNQINRTLEVIIEEENDDGTYVGTAGNYVRITVPPNNVSLKSLIRVRVTDIAGETLIGVPIE